MQYQTSKPMKGKILCDSAQKIVIEATVGGDDEVLARLFEVLLEGGTTALALGLKHALSLIAQAKSEKEKI